jgi:protein gp37
MGWPWEVRHRWEHLEDPLYWVKPQVIAVSYMGDLFHEDVHLSFIEKVWMNMEAARQHTFLVLTKRPAGMLDVVRAMPRRQWWDDWPLPNVWLGVSIESQEAADERIPLLLETPAAHRWVSAEPLLEPVDMSRFLTDQRIYADDPWHYPPAERPGPNWVVIGGESGPHHRPCDPAWIADIVDQCDAAGVPVYVKQASHRYPGRQGDIPDELWARKQVPW